jgi:hypothetical protein
MAMSFSIREGATYPALRMELIEDGRYDFHKAKINNALQDSDVVFSMKDIETGILKVSKAKAVIKNADTEGCEDKYVVEYDWQTRDTAKPGIYEGWFDIDFKGDVVEAGVDYPSAGKLRIPVTEDLLIYVR